MDTYSNPQESPELGQFLEILSGPWQRPWRWSWGHLQVQTSREKLGYPLVMTNTSPWYRWSIEIDGLPIKKWWFSMATLNNQMVTSDHQKVMWLFPASPFLTTRVSRSSRCSLKDKKRCDSSPRRRHFAGAKPVILSSLKWINGGSQEFMGKSWEHHGQKP